MKTAMQELIEWFYNRPEYDKTSEGYEIMEKAKELLEKEKEQIIDAYINGYTSYDSEMSGFEYYTQTHSENK
jgi:hypothetical protein